MKRRCISCKEIFEAEDIVLLKKKPFLDGEHPYCKECADTVNEL